MTPATEGEVIRRAREKFEKRGEDAGAGEERRKRFLERRERVPPLERESEE